MTWVTIVLTGLFLLLAIAGALWFRPMATQADAPTFTPNGAQPISDDQWVTIKAEEGNKIYYLTTSDPNDETNPTSSSDEFTTAFRVSPGTIVKAIAYPQRGDASEVVTVRYRAPSPEAPTLDPMPDPENPITGDTEVTVTPASEGDKIYYTTNGDEPTEGSRLYNGPILVSPKMELRVKAFVKHADPSPTVTVVYGVKAVDPVPPAIPATTTAPAATTQPATTPAPTTQPATIPAATTQPEAIPAPAIPAPTTQPAGATE